MRVSFALAFPAIAVVAIAIAACGGPQPAAFVNPPTSSTLPAGSFGLTQSSQTQAVGSASGITGTLVYVGGSGTVSASSSATAPAGTTTVTPAERVRVEASSSPTSPNVYYVTITSPSGATLNGLPGINLALSSPAVGTFQEAQFTSGGWTNVPGATPTENSTATAVAFPPGTTKITIAAGGSIYLAFYQGTFPEPTPSPVGSPTNIIADSTFTSATYADWPAVPTAGGWTQCSFDSSAPGSTATHPYPSGTPDPGETPLATIEAVGASAPSVGTPAATQTTVPGPAGGNAAVLGGSFVGYALEDFRYQGLCQVVTVPQNPQLNLNVFAAGNQAQKYFQLEVDQLNSSGQFVANLYTDPNPIGSPAADVGDTNYRSVSVPTSALTPLVGQTVTLFLGIYGDGHGSYSGYYFVDSFQLLGNP